MPPKKSKEAWFRDWIGRLNGNSVYSINSTQNGKGIYCEACQQQVFKNDEAIGQQLIFKKVNVDEFGQLKQHMFQIIPALKPFPNFVKFFLANMLIALYLPISFLFTNMPHSLHAMSSDLFQCISRFWLIIG
jgi:hypothetical protein